MYLTLPIWIAIYFVEKGTVLKKIQNSLKDKSRLHNVIILIICGVRDIWSEYYEKLLNEESDWRRDKLEKVDPVNGPAEDIKASEVREASGPSGVVSEMLKAAGESGVEWLTSIFNGVIRGRERFPRRLEKELVGKKCLQKERGDALACASYRGMKLLDQVMKILGRVLEKRNRERVTLDELQLGFRPGRGTIDAIFIVRQMQEKFLAKKKELWMAFVDLEKAFR